MNPAEAPSVVVAEDEAVIRLDLVEQLRELGYQVVAACGDGAAAVQHCRDLAPDLALLDINMPVLDGLAAARQIAGLGTTAVVMLTAYGQREVVDQAIDVGAMAYLTKPWSEGDLMAALALARARFAELRAVTTRADALAESLENRKLIDRAKARLIQAYDLTEAEAFRLLQRRAMDERTSMAAVSRQVLESGQGS